MSEALTKIQGIKKEIKALISKQAELNTEIETLKQVQKTLKGEVEGHLKTIENLIEKNKTLELAKSLKQGEGNRDVKKRIDEMVREIDKCIELLNK
ncbi:MAG: hypothetical protein KDC09_04620 [Bacteroidales bacterium]|nr:hypothetical protein [Bacteroidales bacterium]